MATMGFAQVGFLVLLCLSFCSARRVLTDTKDVEKPDFARSFQATQSTSDLKSGGGISSLDNSKWQSGGKGGHCSGGGGGGGGSACCGGNEGCSGCGNFGGGGYCDGCGNFGCGGGGNYQGGCYCSPPPTCGPVTCPPVSNCCPVGCPPGYGHPKVAAQQWAPPRQQIILTGNNADVQPDYGHSEVAAHHWANLQVPPSPKDSAQHWAIGQAPPRPEITLKGTTNQDHDEHKPNIKDIEDIESHIEARFSANNYPKPNYSDKETQLGPKTEADSKNEPAPPDMQEDVSKNEFMN